WSVLNIFGTAQLKTAIDSAIGQNGLPGNVRSVLRSEPNDHVGDLLGAAKALDRGFSRPAVADLLRRTAGGQSANLGQFLQTFRGGVTRSHVVHQDSVF